MPITELLERNAKEYFKQMHRTAKEALNLIENGASESQILEKLAELKQPS